MMDYAKTITMTSSMCKALEHHVFDGNNNMQPLVSLCIDYWQCLTDYGKHRASMDAMIGEHRIISIHTHHGGTVRMFTELREMLDPTLSMMENKCAICLSFYEQVWVVLCVARSMMNAFQELMHEGWR